MEQWTRSDFYSMAASSTTRTPSGPASARMPNISNSVPRSARREIRSGANDALGSSQGATIYADGVVCHSTAGHGGFHLDAAHNAKVHPALRAADGWYEEDCAWAAVAQAFPSFFTDYEQRCADRTNGTRRPFAADRSYSAVMLNCGSASPSASALLLAGSSFGSGLQGLIS